MSDLDNVFSGTAEQESEPAAPQVETVLEVKNVETENPEVNIDKEVPKAEDKPAEEPETWTKKAVLDERRKRQALEAELEKLKQEQPKREAIDARLDLLEDPDAFSSAINSKIEQVAIETRINLSREMMMDKHDDYEEKEQIFIDMAKAHPELQREALASSNPAKFVYEEAKKIQEFQQMRDGSLVEKMRAELTEQIRKELEAEKAKASTVRPSLARETSASNEIFVEPDLNSIFKR